MGQNLHYLRMILTTFVPQRRKPNPRHALPAADKKLEGKTIVFIGGTDGMGRVAVEMLYEMGADIVLLGRNESKTLAVIEAITAGHERPIHFERCDLASMASVRTCAERVLSARERIDVLINCAGANLPTRRLTQEGFETVFAINYLGPVLLTRLLLERLKASGSARIVNLSSAGEAMGHIHFDDLQLEHGWSPGGSYAQAKLGLNMFTIELARELETTDVRVNALNPGFIQSNLLRDLEGIEGMFRGVMRVFASPPEVGADRIVRLAVSSEYRDVSGEFVYEDAIAAPNPEASDPEIRTRLMAASESMLGPWLGPIEA